MFSTCLSFSPHVILRAVLGKRAPDRKETPRKDSWLSNGHFRPPAAQINLIYGEISRLRFFTMESVQCQSFLGKNRLKVISLGAELQWNCVNNFALLLDFDRTPARQFNGHFSIPQCAKALKARGTSFCGREMGGAGLIFSGRSICRSPIFTVGLELEGTALSSEKNKEKEVKKQSILKKDNLETIDCFSKGKGNFLISFPFSP